MKSWQFYSEEKTNIAPHEKKLKNNKRNNLLIQKETSSNGRVLLYKKRENKTKENEILFGIIFDMKKEGAKRKRL